MNLSNKFTLFKIPALFCFCALFGPGWHQLISPAYGLEEAQEEPATGRWRPLKIPSHLITPEKNDEELSPFMSVGYLQGYNPAPEVKNVTVYDKRLAYQGLNLYTSGHAPEAILMDMEGNVLHKWHFDAKQIWPDATDRPSSYFMRVKLFENGDLMVLFINRGIIKIDKDSNLLWSHSALAHHDFNLDGDGNIYFLTDNKIKISTGDYIRDNEIVILSPGRKTLKRISLFRLLEKSPYFGLYFPELASLATERAKMFERFGMKMEQADVFHTNTLEVFDGSLSEKSPFYKKGNVLICIKTLGILAIVDTEGENIVWLKGPGLWQRGIHNSVLLTNGNILVFDNFNTDKTHSRVIEFDPWTMKLVWDYRQKDADEFFSIDNGTNQRLPNGNTLITESGNGRVFEVTPNKKIVWEFFNPHRTGDHNELIAVIHEMSRLPPDLPLSWLPKKYVEK